MQNVFILGNPRSGTSLLRLMLNNNPLIAAPPECGFLIWWYDKYKNWSVLNCSNEKDVRGFVSDLISSKKIETWSLNPNILIKKIIKEKPKSYSELGTLVYNVWANSRDKSPSVIVDKNNYYIKHLNALLEIWGDAKFIYIVRDGRDVACSYIDMKYNMTKSPYKPQLPVKISDIASEWCENNGNILSFLNKQPKENYIKIRYEDLITESKETLIFIMDFLKIPFSDKMMHYFNNNDEPLLTIDWKMKTLEKPDCSRVGRFRKDLKKQEIDSFNFIAFQLLRLFGYEE